MRLLTITLNVDGYDDDSIREFLEDAKEWGLVAVKWGDSNAADEDEAPEAGTYER